MQHRDPQELPEDLRPLAEWLRAQRPEVNALELDRIKQRARVQAMGAERTGPGIARARRPLATALTALVLTVSLGGALAIAGNGPPSSPFNSASSNGSAAKKQYCDDKDKKHACKPKPCHKKHGCKPKPKPKPKPGHHH